MKPSFTTTLSRPPKDVVEEEAVGILLTVINQVFAAKMGSKTPITLIQDYDQIIAAVAGCSRMTAFIAFHGYSASLEISFSESKRIVRIFEFSYYFNPRRLIFSGQVIY